ncbi:hydroxyphenylacetyl-CoA thioesterase PaaI [Nioella sediminis]|jgi:acyl-CoA thioesterase|uniref:hydroxyphenylacetyl-CoA thioesterase PaaI n=1 Tax=Nioella sediminis TaxID=1912092 RepID=UPI0008FD4308|nr:hydroxyphenylacetyl-CoA thioesterase PaaI [Nioella sediminis]TBX21541.1 phenylacetic acid degradation protein PaaD [Roseovarius sp. JS7-11]
MTPETRAQKSAEAMWADDNASPWFGMEIVEVSEGRATLALTVESHHANGHGICHGGVTFSLADSAFAFACNSRNQSTVAQTNTITYVAPGRVGDRLTATAREISLTGRSGIYDVTVTNQNGTVIAEFRGNSRAIKGQLFEE